ncbi:MAG TPA: extracellular substrate binding-like orphan protein GrrP [Chroococcidiopsis sp.]
MEKVARTGVLTVGTRFDAIPYSYVNDRGQLVGYSIDALNLIKDQLQQELGRTVSLQMVEANDPAQRIPLLTSGQIDISCDTQFTWERDRYVDFSVSYSISGIRLLTRQDSTLGTPESLVAKRIGVLPNSTGHDVMQLVQPRAILVPIQTAEEGLAALNAGRVDALAGDSVVLGGMVQPLGADNYRLAPVEPYERFGLACMVPENNSSFLNQVNYALVGMMQRYVSGDSTTVAMVNRWFGADGIVPLPGDLVQGFFETIIIQHAQVPPVATPAATPAATNPAP